MPRSGSLTRLLGFAITIYVIYFLFTTGSTDTSFRRTTEAALRRKHSLMQGDLTDEEYRDQTHKKLQEVVAEHNKDKEIDDDDVRHADPAIAAAAAVAPKAAKAATTTTTTTTRLAAKATKVPGVKPVKQAVDEDESEDETATKKQSKSKDEDEEAEAEAQVSVAGRKSMPKSHKDTEGSSQKYPVKDGQEVLAKEKTSKQRTKHVMTQDDGMDLAREKLQGYLKKPVVIFSKSTCPYSKRAKQLLLETYNIVPTPIVVELDELTERVSSIKISSEDDDEGPSSAPTTLGRKIQQLLGEITGRTTVPNIMINMRSIGGNDEIQEKHANGVLAEEIKKMGGKRIQSIEFVKAQPKRAL